MIFLSTWVICRFHLNLPGCIPEETVFTCNVIYVMTFKAMAKEDHVKMTL